MATRLNSSNMQECLTRCPPRYLLPRSSLQLLTHSLSHSNNGRFVYVSVASLPPSLPAFLPSFLPKLCFPSSSSTSMSPLTVSTPAPRPAPSLAARRRRRRRRHESRRTRQMMADFLRSSVEPCGRTDLYSYWSRTHVCVGSRLACIITDKKSRRRLPTM